MFIVRYPFLRNAHQPLQFASWLLGLDIHSWDISSLATYGHSWHTNHTAISLPNQVPIYTSGWREAIETKRFAEGRKHDGKHRWHLRGSNPPPLDLESSTHATRPSCSTVLESLACWSLCSTVQEGGLCRRVVSNKGDYYIVSRGTWGPKLGIDRSVLHSV